jgi:hypothetical protein
MNLDDRHVPGDGTFSAAFVCPSCSRRMAMLANPMETQLVDALGVQIGGRTLDAEPLELVRKKMVGTEGAFEEGAEQPGDVSAGRPRWSAAAHERLERIPGFVRGMVKKIYTEYAVDRGITEITPEIMDRARTELGLEGM